MKFDRISIENRSRDPPGAPWTSKECLGTIWSVPGALWECPGSGPGAARERPRSTKRGTFEGSKFEQIRETKFRSHFEHVEPKNDRIFGRYSSTVERILKGNLMICDSTEMEPILNIFCRTSSKNRERGTWPKYRACQQKQGFGRFRGLLIFDRSSLKS